MKWKRYHVYTDGRPLFEGEADVAMIEVHRRNRGWIWVVDRRDLKILLYGEPGVGRGYCEFRIFKLEP